MDVLSPFIPVLCHSDWLFHGESCPRLDVVHPGRAWPSSSSCTWHCSLHYLFLQATPLFPHCGGANIAIDVSVCLSARISQKRHVQTSQNRSLHVTRRHGSVLLWRQCNSALAYVMYFRHSWMTRHVFTWSAGETGIGTRQKETAEPSTAAANVTLLRRRAAERRAAVAVDRYLVSAGPAPANPPHLAAAVYSWNRQTDGRTSSDTVPAA